MNGVEMYDDGWYTAGSNPAGWNFGWNWTASTGPAAAPDLQVAALKRHAPRAIETCAQADRAADEQIAGLLEELHKPCPHCGERRTET